MSTATTTAVSFELGCSGACNEFSEALYLQMSSGRYDVCAVLELPANVADWRERHRTARKRADRAFARGYNFVPKLIRHRRADEIYRLNTSAATRQGKPMGASYFMRPSETPLPDYPCERHGVHSYGVEDRDGVLVAYAFIYRAGDLALVSQILGHADHLKQEIMYLLVQGIVGREKNGYLVYNRWDSGTDGLRFFKERLGFECRHVEWLP